MKGDSQDVADDANRPKIGAEADRFEVDDFGRHELGRAEQHLQLFGRVKAACQAEIDQLDSITHLGQA